MAVLNTWCACKVSYDYWLPTTVFCTLRDKWFPTHGGEGRWRLLKLTRLCVLLYSPPGLVAWIDKPKTLVTSEGHLVIGINIRVNRTARRLENNARSYTEGGNVAVRGLCVCTKFIHRTPFRGLRTNTGLCWSKWTVFPRRLNMRCDAVVVRTLFGVSDWNTHNSLHSTYRATPGVTHTDGRFISRGFGHDTVQSGTLIIRRRDTQPPLFSCTHKTMAVYSTETSVTTYQTIRSHNNPHRRDDLKIHAT